MMVPLRHVVYYVNPQERKPQAQRDWLDLLQGRAHNVHEVDVCALSLLCKSNQGVSSQGQRDGRSSCGGGRGRQLRARLFAGKR